MTSATAPALRFHDVWKSYETPSGESLHALREVTASVPAGAKIAVVGRSGSGKSTFLHLAAAIDSPTRGRIEWGGEDLSSATESRRTKLRRQRIGLIFQFFHLLPHLDVLGNVILPSGIAGDRLGPARERARQLLDRVGLLDRASERADRLSGGEMQRVAICRALSRSPQLLLADEPTGNLDDDNARRVMELLLQLVDDEGGTLVFVTHSDEMAAMGDATWRIHSGILETDPA